MNKIVTFWVICLFALCQVSSRGDDLTFLRQVDNLWKARNHDQILQLATTEAAKPTPSSEAFAVLFGYHLVIAGNRQQAEQSLTQLASLLETSNPAAFRAVSEFRNEFSQISGAGSSSPTPEMLNEMHSLFPNAFPIRTLLMCLSARE